MVADEADADNILTLVDPTSHQITNIWMGRQMRTVADALNKLDELDRLAPGDSFVIKTTPITLLDRQDLMILAVIALPQNDEIVWRVAMPPSTHFHANSARGARQSFKTEMLEDATVHADGSVELQDGLHLHRVELTPSALPHKLSEKQLAIVHQAMVYLDPQLDCLRTFDAEYLPDWRSLDFSTLPRLKHPHSLKVVAGHIAEHLSIKADQSISTALEKAGMRIPRSGKRSSRRA